MTAKLDTTMEVCPTIVENCNSIMEISPKIVENCNSTKFPEDKVMVCASNCEDNAFDNPVNHEPEEKVMMMTCASNCEDDTFPMEVSPVDHDHIVASEGNNENVEVDIVEIMNPNEESVSVRESQDVTESSSSFGYTDSGIGSAEVSSDVEVESQVRDDNSSLVGFEGCNDLFRTRKKKLTDHWRNFIRPLMWRCKWVELHIRQLQSQASKYDRELSEYDRRKQCELDKCATEAHGTKSIPFVCQNRPVKVMKRKKRKRVEETVNLASYTSSHSLFSYYAGKRSSVDFAYMDDYHGNNDMVPAAKTPFGIDKFGVNVEWSFFEFKDSDAFESILRKIDEAQVQVCQLRVRMDKVVSENAEKFTPDNSGFAPWDPVPSCAEKSVLPLVNAEEIPLGSMCATSQQTSEKKLVMPESVVSSHGEVTPSLDMIESTDQPQIGGKCGKGDIVVNVKREAVGVHSITEPMLTPEAKAENGEQRVSEPDSPSKMTVTRDQPTVKIRSISKLITPKNKRKRGRRKARSGRWSRRSSG